MEGQFTNMEADVRILRSFGIKYIIYVVSFLKGQRFIEKRERRHFQQCDRGEHSALDLNFELTF